MTTKQIEQLAEHWFRQSSRTLEPLWKPGELVPFNNLPASSEAQTYVGAIQEELRTEEYRDSGAFNLRPTVGWKHCMNCGGLRPEVSENGGWCDACERGK